MAQWTLSEAKEIMEKASKKAATDPAFRSKLLADPNAAVSEFSGKQIPSNIKVRALERSGYDVTLLLPDAVSKEGELSDAELEQVAGGGRCAGTCVVSCGVETA
jgi:hypothetical protein